VKEIMNLLITLTSFVVLLTIGGCFTSHTQAKAAFDSVMIESHPKGWGYAHKTVEKSGTVTGAHMSGGPEAVQVFQTNSELTPEDMNRLMTLVAALQNTPLKSTVDPPDQKSEGYMSVIICFDESKSITVHARWGQQFEPPNLQAIWDLVYKYDVGAW
jgi:hypothetical protein